MLSPRATTTPTTGTPKPDEEPYFGQTKYLTVSAQLHLEAYSAALGNVWCLSPTFRAELSDTPRHLAEFYMLEAEYRGVTRLAQVQQAVQGWMRFVLDRLATSASGRELAQYYAEHDTRGRDVLTSRHRAIHDDWVLADYGSVVDELTSAHDRSHGKLFRNPPAWHRGLALEHERWAVENLAQHRPLVVSHYPQAIKPFYMLPSHPDPPDHPHATVACFDVLLPFGFCEVVGGSLREHRLDRLVHNMRHKRLIKTAPPAPHGAPYPHLQPGESLGPLQWYADLRRFGSSPHGGFGLGFDRYLAYLAGLDHIRDAVGFPRAWRRADC